MKEILIAIFISSALLIFPQNNNVLSYDDYISAITEKLPEIKINNNKLKSAKNDYIKSLNNNNIIFDFSASGIGEKTYPDGNITDINYSRGFLIESNISATLPTGTYIKIGGQYKQLHSDGIIRQYNFDSASNGTIDGIGNPFYYIDPTLLSEDKNNLKTVTFDPAIIISIRQPLLYNWFGFLNRSSAKDAAKKIIIEEIRSKELNKEILIYYKKLYFKWIQYLLILNLLEKTIKNQEALYSSIIKKYNLQLTDIEDVEQVKYSIYQYKEQYKSIETELISLRNQLFIFFDTKSISPDMEIFNKYFKKSIDSEFNFINFNKTNHYKIISHTRERLLFLKKIRRNENMPELDLFADMKIKFHKYHEIIDNNIKENIYKGNLDFIAGISFKYSILNFESKSNYKEIKIQLEDLENEYSKIKNTYEKNLSNIITYVSSYKELLDLKENSIKSLIKIQDAQKKKQKQGRLEMEYLIQTKSSLFNEKISSINIKMELIKMLFEYQNLTSLESNK